MQIDPIGMYIQMRSGYTYDIIYCNVIQYNVIYDVT